MLNIHETRKNEYVDRYMSVQMKMLSNSTLSYIIQKEKTDAYFTKKVGWNFT